MKLYDRTKDEITLSEVERIRAVTLFDPYAVMSRRTMHALRHAFDADKATRRTSEFLRQCNGALLHSPLAHSCSFYDGKFRAPS
jgi:hypothetical protein